MGGRWGAQPPRRGIWGAAPRPFLFFAYLLSLLQAQSLLETPSLLFFAFFLSGSPRGIPGYRVLRYPEPVRCCRLSEKSRPPPVSRTLRGPNPPRGGRQRSHLFIRRRPCYESILQSKKLVRRSALESCPWVDRNGKTLARAWLGITGGPRGGRSPPGIWGAVSFMKHRIFRRSPPLLLFLESTWHTYTNLTKVDSNRACRLDQMAKRLLFSSKAKQSHIDTCY